MLITTEGIVIRERFVGENDKFIDILTKEYGIIEVSVKGAKKINSKASGSTQIYTYSKFCFSQKGDRYFMNSCEPIKVFYNIRLDVNKFALASYFSELLKFSVVSQVPSKNVLRLFLNTLHYMTESTRSEALIKSVFELRLMTEIGLMPDLVACAKCHEYTSTKNYFYINNGCFICKKCYSGDLSDDVMEINEAVLHTLRYIVFSDFNKLFNFKISDNVQKVLSVLTERYLLSHMNRNFKTLEFYKSL